MTEHRSRATVAAKGVRGNLGDDVRKAGREPEGQRANPATTSERPV